MIYMARLFPSVLSFVDIEKFIEGNILENLTNMNTIFTYNCTYELLISYLIPFLIRDTICLFSKIILTDLCWKCPLSFNRNFFLISSVIPFYLRYRFWMVMSLKIYNQSEKLCIELICHASFRFTSYIIIVIIL